MNRSRARLRSAASVVPALLGLLLTACAAESTQPGQSGSGGGAFEVDVDVATPELRTIKQRAGIEPCEPGQGSPVEGGLPDITLACLGGGDDVNLASLRGPMVLNLWAQWCEPCREELPYYQRLHQQAGDELQVIGLDYQDVQPRAALELAEQAGVTYPLVADPAAETRVPFRVRGLPGVVMVDADGTVTHLQYVVIRSYDQLVELVEQHLDVSVPRPNGAAG